MARRDQVVRHLQIDAIRQAVEAPSLVYVDAPLWIHTRSDTAGVCPCCGNEFAKIAEERPDLKLLIDLDEGTRDLRHQMADPGIFDDLAEGADMTVTNGLRCSAAALALVTSDTRIVVGQGASRSSKTQHGVVWGFRQWMLRGGPEVEALFCGPELRHAHLILRKWALGEGKSPPVCDPRLILSHPTRLRQEDQTVRMLDGTVIHLAHLKGDGANIAGMSPAWINGTEIAKVHDIKNWGQMRTRVISTGGNIYMDAVPEPKHWFKAAVIDPAQREDDEAQIAEEKGDPPPERSWHVLQLSAEDNPWNKPGEGERAIRDIAQVDPRLAERYGAGDWVGDRNLVFSEFLDTQRHTFDYEGWDVERLGLVDVTRAASLMLFPQPRDWLISVDINGWPHTALVSKIAVAPEHAKGVPATRLGSIDRRHWILVCFDYVQVWGVDSMQAAEHLATLHRGKFKGAGVIVPPDGFWKKHNAGGALNSKRKIVPAKAYQAAGFLVRPPDKTPNGKPGYPSRHDSAIVGRRLLRGDDGRLLINSVRCSRFIGALRDQESEADGITPAKSSNTYQDAHIVSGTDVYRYIVWPFFRLDKPTTANDRQPRFYA